MAKHKRLKPIGDYLYDKGEMIEQMFSSIPIVEIRNMVPIKLQGMPLHELKAECLVELLGISDREVLNILDGKKDRNVSSSDSDQGGFVMSDEERKVTEKRIKKEKKDTNRKVKTDRISSKKDATTSQSSEPSTSKKKRKSKEIVDVYSKKKKPDDGPADIPSSSRDVSKVPTSKKKDEKKKKKKKKNFSKKEEEEVNEIVVLDDDSDKEEKRGQKSLLDLLELEMRARAIRSLLKKEEAVQAQKILNEYKDEPDDLIPIDIEPPQIELLSDSDGEETTENIYPGANRNTNDGKMNENISSKQPEGSLQRLEDQGQYSGSPSGGPNDDSNSLSCDPEKVATSVISNEILNGSTCKSANEIEDQAAKSHTSDPSVIAVKDWVKNDEASIINTVSGYDDMVQPNVSGDIYSVETGEMPGSSGPASKFSSPSKKFNVCCEPLDKSVGKVCMEQDDSKIDSPQKPEKSVCISSPADNSKNEIGCRNFLVIEESSIDHAMGGSQIKEAIIEENSSSNEMKPSSNVDTNKAQNPVSIENVDCLTVQEEFQQPTVAEISQIDSKLNLATGKNAFNKCSSNFVVPSFGKDANRDVLVEGDTFPSKTSGVNLTLHTPTERRESTNRCLAEDDSLSHFVDEVLDYDYNPVNSYFEKESKSIITPSKNSPSSEAEETFTEEKKSGEKLNDLAESTYKVSSDFELFEPETDSRAVYLGNNDANLVHSSDLLLEEAGSKTYPIVENLGTSILENDLERKPSSKSDICSKTQLETVKQKEDVPSDFNNCVEGIDGSNAASDEFSYLEADVEDSRENIYAHERGTHSCLNLKPPVDDTSEELSDSPEHNQMTTEQDLTLQLPASNSGSSENRATISTVSDDLIILKEESLNVGKGETLQNSSSHEPEPEYSADLALQTSIINSEQVDRTLISEPCRSFRSDDGSDVIVISTVESNQTIQIPVDCNSCRNTSDEIIEEGQTFKCNQSLLSSTASCAANSANSISSQILDPLLISKDLVILDSANELQVSNMSSTDANTPGSDVTPQDLINADVAEIIDISEQELVDSSEVVFVSEERIESDSIDESDNEMFDKAALVLEQMNSILNDDIICRVSESSSDGSSQPSPQSTSVVSAKVYDMNGKSSSSEYATDEQNEEEEEEEQDDDDDELPNDNTVSEVFDLDTSEEETRDEETSDTNGSENSLDRGSIEIIDDSDSVCSVKSQRDDPESDDCLVVLQPQGSISDDCIIVTESDVSENRNMVVSSEPEGSESNNLASISQHSETTLAVRPNISNKDVPLDEATGSLVFKNPLTPTGKESVMVTIVIEDDDGEEEEVQLVTEDVPAEILELGDDDEAKTNWTSRWLESDNVKKVVQTSKILTNVRKQMKMKLKKIDAKATNDLKLPEEKCAPPLIGSVEEYHRLVKEGVIFSNTMQNDEKAESSNNSINNAIDPSELSTTVSAGRKVQEGHEKKYDEEKSGKKKKIGKHERKKKLDKCERKRKSEKYKKKKSDEFCSYTSVSKISQDLPSPESKETDKLYEKSEVLDIGKVVVEDEVREDGEITESPIKKVPNCSDTPKERFTTSGREIGKVFGDQVCRKEQNSGKDEDGNDREEGETSEKEEGEISDSGCDEMESHESTQPEPSTVLKTAIGSKECSRRLSELSFIPLPQKPSTEPSTTQQHTTHPKQLPSKTLTKTPDRNSAAKRFILRNLQLGRKRAPNSKNKKKKKKGGGRGKKTGLGYTENAAPVKNKGLYKPQTACNNPTSQTVNSLTSASDTLQTVPGIQPSYQALLNQYSGLSQPGTSMSRLGSEQNTTVNVSNTAQVYDSYYSWAYSQGLVSSASGNYGYGMPESTPDPNVYKQWEEYYRKLMEACKVSAEHASAGSSHVSSGPTTEKSGYTWVFDHSSGASLTPQVQQTTADSTTEPVAQVQAPDISSQTSEASQSVAPVTNEIFDKDRFESWQYRYGLKGLLKEHFIPAPNAPSTGGESQKS